MRNEGEIIPLVKTYYKAKVIKTQWHSKKKKKSRRHIDRSEWKTNKQATSKYMKVLFHIKRENDRLFNKLCSKNLSIWGKKDYLL